MNIRDLAERLSMRAEDLALELLPNGKREGSEWRCGSVHGEPGKSFGLKLSGGKAGLWCDFATGEAGDLVDLWALHRTGGKVGDAVKEIKNYLGIYEPEFSRIEKKYSRPEKPKCGKPKNQAMDYLISRGFTQQTIQAYRVAADARSIYFPSLRDGELVMCKWRSISEKKTAPTSSGQEPCLFGWQAIPDDARKIYITEGEFDAMAMWQMGYPALSVPFGGGDGAKQQWIETEYENLDRFESIYLCLDNDQEGEKASRAISERLGIERCYRVTLPAKDANECLQEALDISKSISNAKNYDPAHLKNAIEYTDAVIQEFYPPEGKQDYIPIPWPKAQGKLELRESELSLWNGMNGSGKSEILGFIALRAIKQGRRVCIASMELKPQKLLKRMVRQAAAVSGAIPSIPYIKAIQEWLSEGLWIFECTGTAKKEELFKTSRYARKRYGIDLFIVDSLMKCGIAEDDYSGQKLFVEALCDLKNELDFHIALVTHSRKKESEKDQSGKMDIRGSGSISDLADTVINVWRNKIKEEKIENPKEDDDLSELEEKYPDTVLICDKQRNGDWEGKIGLWFCKYTKQYLNSSGEKPRPFINFSINNSQVS